MLEWPDAEPEARSITLKDIRLVEWALQRCDARLLEVVAPDPADLTLAKLHSAVVGGLIQCSRLREQLLGRNEEAYEECA